MCVDASIAVDSFRLVRVSNSGMHSGAVTAGVLRSERSRFQLFGETVNTASRMESTGERDKIQISEETANLLIKAGKKKWIIPRDEKIAVNGKGDMQTYWLSISSTNRATGSSQKLNEPGHRNNHLGESIVLTQEKTVRLVQWVTDILLQQLRQMTLRRASEKQALSAVPWTIGDVLSDDWTGIPEVGLIPMDEMKEVVCLPKLVANARYTLSSVEIDAADRTDLSRSALPEMELDACIEQELREFVSEIASLYGNNHFHNFDHASHVTMSVVKLLSRITSPQIAVTADDVSGHEHFNRSAFQAVSAGIASDPLTQFSCVFSALIHDVAHPGLSNIQILDEHPDIGAHYKGKSMREQNSIDVAWAVLRRKQFARLRSCIAPTVAEQRSFRQLVVNSVMATDITDVDMKILRRKRWEKAFSDVAQDGDKTDAVAKDIIDLRATLVIEHLIQASDVSHCMQHWQVYRKWNERLFREMNQLYLDGHSNVDPSVNWYQSELDFFDSHVLPLTKKLAECGVFGVSSSEYLDYATKNRHEWERRGNAIVDRMVEEARARGQEGFVGDPLVAANQVEIFDVSFKMHRHCSQKA
jgi:3'5'-cyclic nucleotide phosphodiesterase/Adenylate and Guanylate cyclase catalytic domain